MVLSTSRTSTLQQTWHNTDNNKLRTFGFGNFKLMTWHRTECKPKCCVIDFIDKINLISLLLSHLLGGFLNAAAATGRLFALHDAFRLAHFRMNFCFRMQNRTCQIGILWFNRRNPFVTQTRLDMIVH